MQPIQDRVRDLELLAALHQRRATTTASDVSAAAAAAAAAQGTANDAAATAEEANNRALLGSPIMFSARFDAQADTGNALSGVGVGAGTHSLGVAGDLSAGGAAKPHHYWVAPRAASLELTWLVIRAITSMDGVGPLTVAVDVNGANVASGTVTLLPSLYQTRVLDLPAVELAAGDYVRVTVEAAGGEFHFCGVSGVVH